MSLGYDRWILILLLITSCNNSQTRNITVDSTSTTFIVTDSSREKLVNALGDIIKSHSGPNDISVTGQFIKQGKYENGDAYLTMKTGDSTITLLNLMFPLKENEIGKLKKNGNNLTVTFDSVNKKVKFLSVLFEQEK
jgi:hypothetical protein